MYRRLGKRALDYATAAATKRGMLTDSQCGFRVFSSRALDLMEPSDNGLSIESQMLLEAQERKLRIHEVGIGARYDLEGSTLGPARHGTSVLRRIITVVSERRPLFFFGLCGIAMLLFSFEKCGKKNQARPRRHVFRCRNQPSAIVDSRLT